VLPPLGAPTVDAGLPQIAQAGATVTLNGQVTDPNNPPLDVAAQWTQAIGDPIIALTDAGAAVTTFGAPTLNVGDPTLTLTFHLTATNSAGSTTGTTTVEVLPPLGAPTVDAGLPQVVPAGATVTLNGQVTDPNNPPLEVTAQWTQASGDPIIALTDAGAAVTTFGAPTLNVGDPTLTLTFHLTATNAVGATIASTTVDVLPPLGQPILDAIPPQSVPAASMVSFTASAADPNAPPLPLSHTWRQTTGPSVQLINPTAATVTFLAPALAVGQLPAMLTFVVTVSNGTLATEGTTSVEVIPPVGPPTVDAGRVQSVAAESPVTLRGDARDPNAPAKPLTFEWVQTSGPPVELINPAQLTATFVAPAVAPGDPALPLGFSLTVSNGVFSTTALTTVVVQPRNALLAPIQTVFSDGSGHRTTPPFLLNAGDLVVAFVSGDLLNALLPGPQAATVSGGGLAWTLVRRVTAQFGTSEVWTTIAPATLPNATVTATMAFPTSQTSLTVMTFAGSSGIGASAGASASSGAPTVSLRTTRGGSRAYAVGNDWDGTVARTPAAGQTLVHQYLGPMDTHWVQTLTSGAIWPSDTTVQLRDTAPTHHRWNFVAVEILAVDPIAPPAVNAGAAQTVQAGTQVTLNATASDANIPPRPVSQLWTQSSGIPVTLADAGALTTTFTAPPLSVGTAPQTLGFKIAVNNGAITTEATTSVVVQPPTGPPVVTVWPAQTVAGSTSVIIGGTATDPNNPVRPVTQTWTQTAGPPVSLANANAAITSFVAPALNASDPPVTLEFTLTANNGVLSGSAATTVIVQPQPLDPVGPVSLSVVQTLFSDGTGDRTTAPFAVGVGDLAVAFVSGDLTSRQVPGPQRATVSGGGLPWTLVRRVNAQYGTSEVWAALVPAAVPAVTVTATMAFPTSQTSLAVMTFAGTGGVGTSAGASAGSGAPTVALKTTKAGSLVYGVGNDWDGTTARTTASGQTLVHQYLGPSDTHWVQTLTAGAAGPAGTTVQLRDTAPTNHRWNFAAVEILAVQPLTAPTANAGQIQSVNSGAPVTLNGIATDPNVPARPLTFTWTQTSGPPVTLGTPNALTTSFTAPPMTAGDPPIPLGFTLTVSNGVFTTIASTTVIVHSIATPLAAVQTVFSDGSGHRTAPPVAVGLGDLVVAFVSSDLLSALVPGPQLATVSGGGLSWTLVRRVNAQYGTSEVWAALAPSAGSGLTVTATMAFPTSQTSLTVMTFAGAGGIGASAGANGGSGAPTISLRTTKAGSLVYGVGNDWDGTVSRTPAAGQTLVHQYLGPADTHWVQTLTSGAVPGAGTTVQLRDTAPTNHRWNFAAVEIVVR
jgi:hypothetical protein